MKPITKVLFIKKLVVLCLLSMVWGVSCGYGEKDLDIVTPTLLSSTNFIQPTNEPSSTVEASRTPTLQPKAALTLPATPTQTETPTDSYTATPTGVPALEFDFCTSASSMDVSKRQIAFVADWSGYPEIYIATGDGQNQQQITHEQAPFTAFSKWSSDGNYLAYISGGPEDNRFFIPKGDWKLYVTDLQGSRTLISGLLVVIGDHAWSPIEQKLVFTGEDEDGYYNLYLNKVDGLNLSNLTKLDNYWVGFNHSVWPEWSLDGQRIAFDVSMNRYTGYLLRVIDVENSRWVSLGNSKIDNEYGEEYPTWNPKNSNEILYISTPHRSAVLLDVQTGERRLFIDYRKNDLLAVEQAYWSPDGLFIASVQKSYQGAETSDSVRIDRVENGAWKVIFENPIIHGLDWSPDVRYILLEVYDSQAEQLNLERLDVCSGTVETILEDIELNRGEYWKP